MEFLIVSYECVYGNFVVSFEQFAYPFTPFKFVSQSPIFNFEFVGKWSSKSPLCWLKV